MPEISLLAAYRTGLAAATATRTQMPSARMDRRLRQNRRPFSSTCFDFHMFFLRSLIFSSRCCARLPLHLPFISAAGTFQLMPLTACVCSRWRGAGVSGPPRCKTTDPGCPRRPAITKRPHAALPCRVAGRAARGEAGASENTPPSRLTLTQSQSSSCAPHPPLRWIVYRQTLLLFSSFVSRRAPSLQPGACTQLSSCYLAVTSQPFDSAARASGWRRPGDGWRRWILIFPPLGLRVPTRSPHDAALTIT